MKGKKVFSTVEARKIRTLIRQKLEADPLTQKRIRSQIRALGFYITDFSSKKRYTVADFDQFVTIRD